MIVSDYLKEYIMLKTQLSIIRAKLDLLVQGTDEILYAKDVHNIASYKPMAGDNPENYRYWEWPQGVQLFGIWKLFEKERNPSYLDILEKYYKTILAGTLPGRNVNTTAPMLALSYLAEYTNNKTYMDLCREWARWVMEDMARTEERGLQHIVSTQPNKGELWDDTLFMTVLFLANMGRILRNNNMLDEAAYQFLIHAKYLTDIKTGLWYHGFTFEEGRHNFVNARWGRGNCWVTAAIPLFLEIARPCPSVFNFLQGALEQQIIGLIPLQDKNGLWHTLLDDPASYFETSCAGGFGYGILKGIHDRILPEKYMPVVEKALEGVLSQIDGKGVVQNVSDGTPMGRDSLDFYRNIKIRPMPYGQSLALLLLTESLYIKE